MSLKKQLLVIAVTLYAIVLQAAPQLLEKNPVESPDHLHSVNVEWDAAGFIGRIRILVYGKGERPEATIELPQIKPAPGNLTWITNEWVACESFVAESGAAFFYGDIQRTKGYLLEILAPDTEPDWIISYSINDTVSSDPIHTLTEGKSSIFPILLRNLPQEGDAYLSADFALLMSDAVDSYSNWRKAQKFREMKYLSDVSENPKLGNLVIASIDETAEIIYFPGGTTTTREMLALTQRQKLPQSLQEELNGINPPTLDIAWQGDSGQFNITSRQDEDATTETVLIQGRFEGVKDSVYTGPGISELLKEAAKSEATPKPDSKPKEKSKSNTKISDSKKPSSKSSSSKSSSKSSKSKKPSRSN